MTQEKEDLCLRCGRCCKNHVQLIGEYSIVDGSYCEHFDASSGLCKVYDVRLHKDLLRDSKCLSSDDAAAQRLLPEECPYVKDIPEYKCTVMNR